MLAITNGRIIPIARGEITKGTVLIDRGKIRSVGKSVRVPKSAEVIDATGKVVMPGMIDAHTHCGVIVEGAGPAGSDCTDATAPITPQLHVIDAIDPDDPAFRDAREAGITTVGVAPGSGNVISGQIAAVSTDGRTVEDMLLSRNAGLKLAFGENPKNSHGGKGRMPSTRMGIAAVLREALVEAQHYERDRRARKKSFKRNLKNEVLANALSGKLVVRAHSHKTHDILTMLRIAEEFGLRVVIDHATEAHRIADVLANARVPAVVGPTFSTRRKIELRERTLQTPGILAKAGVKVALTTDHSVVPIHLLPVCAAIAVRHGMDPEQALRAVTIHPAEILGIDKQVGSLEAGKRADVVIMSAHPFDFMSRVEKVLIAGQCCATPTYDSSPLR